MKFALKKRSWVILTVSLAVVVACAVTTTGLLLSRRPQTQKPLQTQESSQPATETADHSREVSASAQSAGAGSGANIAGAVTNGPGAATATGNQPEGGSGNSSSSGLGSGTGTGSGNASGSGAGASSSSGNKGGATTPASAPTPAPAPKPTTVTVTIDCRTVLSNMSLLSPNKVSIIPSSGIILSTHSVTLQAGDSVASVLRRACSSIIGTSYISSAGGLAEFDCGPRSGWVYTVNGVFPSVGVGKYSTTAAAPNTLKAGDSIALRYTCNGGADVGR